MCHTAPAPHVSCLKGNKTKRIDIHIYLGLLDRRLDASTTAICKLESQKNNQVAHPSKRPEVLEQGPGLWLQPVAEEWPVWVCAERLQMLESGVPGWGQAAGHTCQKSRSARTGCFRLFSALVPLGAQPIGQYYQVQGDPVPISYCLPCWSSHETQTYSGVSLLTS